MAGILVPLCEFVLETVWHIIAFLAYGVYFPGLAMCIAFIFEGYHKYQKGSCTNGQALMPAIALPRLLYFPVWLIMLEVLALAGWVLWYLNGRWCDAWIPLLVWAGTFILLAFWPVFMFIVNSALLTFLLFAFVTLWIVFLIGATVVFAFDVFAIIGEVIFLIWMLYQTVFMGIMWWQKGFRFPSPAEILRDVQLRLLGTQVIGGGGAAAGGAVVVAGGAGVGGVGVGGGQVYANAVQPGQFGPSPCGAGFGGGPLATACPKYLGAEMQMPVAQASYGVPQQRQMGGRTPPMATSGVQEWNIDIGQA